MATFTYCGHRPRSSTWVNGEQGPEPKYFYIESLDSRYVLELENSDPCAGARVILADRVPGKQSQIWSYEGLNFLKNNYSGMYLDLKGGRNPGSEVIVWPKTGGLNQQWNYQPSQSTFLNGLDLALDVQNAKKAPGSPLIGFPYHGGVNQKYHKIPAYPIYHKEHDYPVYH
ncbi:hypothetical protein CHUAL_007765 [Chamberlinius hualienensis]